MKKLLLSLLLLGSLVTIAPSAHAGQYLKKFCGYDRHGRPQYEYIHKYGGDDRSGYRNHYYQAPRRVAYYDEYRYARPQAYCAPERIRVRTHHHRPLLSFVFGF